MLSSANGVNDTRRYYYPMASKMHDIISHWHLRKYIIGARQHQTKTGDVI